MNQLDKLRPQVLGLFRIVVGLLFACHGASTLFGIPVEPYGGDSPSFGAWPGWWAAAIELVGGVFVFLGLGTRVAAMVCSGSMAYAYFVEHQKEGVFPIQNSGEPAAMFCWAFLLLLFFGPGSWALSAAVDRVRHGAAMPARAGEEVTTSSR